MSQLIRPRVAITQPGTKYVAPEVRTLLDCWRANVRSKYDPMAAADWAASKHMQGAETVLKALRDPMDQSAWSAAMQQLSNAISIVTRNRNIVGILRDRFRQVPFNTRLLRGDAGSSATFVGEGLAAPVSSMDFSNVTTLEIRKLVAIVIETMELVQFGTPGTDAAITEDIVRAVRETLDSHFLDPAYGPTADQPGSVTYDAPQLDASGPSATQIMSDVQDMIASLVAGKEDFSTAAFIYHPNTLTYMGGLRDAGGYVFPGLGPKGGEILGIPTYASEACAASGSPGESFGVLLEAAGIDYAEDPANGSVEFTNKAALQLDDAPNSAATTLVSLFQNGLSAMRVIQFASWERRRANSVVVLRQITY